MVAVPSKQLPVVSVQRDRCSAQDPEDCGYHYRGTNYYRDSQLPQQPLKSEVYILTLVQAGWLQLCYKVILESLDRRSVLEHRFKNQVCL